MEIKIEYTLQLLRKKRIIMHAINFKHLHYFWTVVKAGGVGRAAERLHLTPQSISGQLRVLEDAVGDKLFRRVGRTLELTETGRLVLSYADEIFTLGDELHEVLRDRPAGRPLPFRVGVADMVPKAMAYRLLEPAMRLPEPLYLLCREGRLADLLADLAVHKLDIVIADRPMPTSLNIRGFNHLLGECGMTFFASPELAKTCRGTFPQNLDGVAMLLPGEDAAVRPKLIRWFEDEHIRPRVRGEFDDGALLKAFGQAGTGVFPAPSALVDQVTRQYGVVSVGETTAVMEQFYAISVERRLTHPAIVAVSSAARLELFASKGKAAKAAAIKRKGGNSRR